MVHFGNLIERPAASSVVQGVDLDEDFGDDDDAALEVKDIINNINDYLDIVSILNSNGYTVTRKYCKTKWFHREFLVVFNRGHQVVIDNDFRGAFVTSYVDFQDVPSLFVGSEEHMLRYIYLLTAELTRIYKEENISLPPWRQLQHIKDIWFNRKHQTGIHSIYMG